MATNVSFDSNSLQTSTILTSAIQHESLPDKIAQAYGLSHGNLSVIPYVGYPSKQIRLTGTILGTSVTNMDSALDTFRGYFRGTSKNLDIDYNGTTRRYIATLTGLTIDRPTGLQYATFDATLFCTQPFGQDTATTTALTAAGRTLTSYSDVYTFLGTAPVQWPIITYTLNSFSSSYPQQAISFSNNATGQGITVNRAFVAGDVVVIDVSQKTVTVNGVTADFIGAFPEFAPGSQTIVYGDGPLSFTARNFNVSIVYYPMYL